MAERGERIITEENRTAQIASLWRLLTGLTLVILPQAAHYKPYTHISYSQLVLSDPIPFSRAVMSAEYTPEQSEIVRKILGFEKSEYYKILHVDKKASETEIKKSYRKLAIKLHPDKNKHPNASEAFKKLAKAFEVLGDESKRRIYDQTGYDPDSRQAAGGFGGGAGAGAGGPGAGFPGFQGFPAGGHPFMNMNMNGQSGFENDLFNFLFSQGAGGASFGGNGFTFNFGGMPGTNPFMYQDPNLRRRRRPNQAGNRNPGAANGTAGNDESNPDTSLLGILKQLSPFLIILIPWLFGILLGDSNGNSLPKFSFEAQPAYSVEKHTPRYKVPYYIDEAANLKYNTPSASRQLGNKVEKIYVNDLTNKCNREERFRQQMIQDSYGWFFPDNEKLQQAQNLPMASCNRLRELNLL